MINQWLKWLNSFLLAMAFIIGGFALSLWFKSQVVIENKDLQTKNMGLPKTSFELDQEYYHEIGGPLLALQESPPTLQVPDLKSVLVYYGKNGRPDAQKDETLLHFALASNSKEIISIKPGKPTYLVFDRSSIPGRYILSPNNEITSLWIVAEPEGTEVQMRVTFENEKGEVVTEPEANIDFRLPEKEINRLAGNSWEIGSFRVDATLLARQKARWYGPDQFLEHHGGKDYDYTIGRQRIDFGEADAIYSIFVKAGDTLIWENDKWQVVEPGQASLGKPLLVVKRVDERLIAFELWDVEGKGKVAINLLKGNEPWNLQNPQTLTTMFKFLGSRTRSQCVFEINRERMVLSPSDWLLLTPKGWIKLSSEEEIDQYVKRKLTGTLFIFEGVGRQDDRQVIQGQLYSPGRHNFQEIELVLPAGSKPSSVKEVKEIKDNSLREAKEVADLLGEILAPLRQEAENAATNPTSSSTAGKKEPPKGGQALK